MAAWVVISVPGVCRCNQLLDVPLAPAPTRPDACRRSVADWLNRRGLVGTAASSAGRIVAVVRPAGESRHQLWPLALEQADQPHNASTSPAGSDWDEVRSHHTGA